MASEIRTKAVIKDVKVEDIRVGDRLMQDMTGQDGKSLLLQGMVISAREILFLRKQLNRQKPRYSAERYLIGQKTPGLIADRAGTVLVRSGQVVTVELLAPLLKEGFQAMPTNEGGEMYYRRNDWPKDKPWHINDFNPLVRVETVTYIDEAGKEIDDPRGKKQAVGAPAGGR